MLGVYDLKVGIIEPSKALQSRLIDVISSATYQRLHNPDYSAIANPYNNRYQNCTEFVTNVIFASIYKTNNMQEIKTSIRYVSVSQRRSNDTLNWIKDVTSTTNHSSGFYAYIYPSTRALSLDVIQGFETTSNL